MNVNDTRLNIPTKSHYMYNPSVCVYCTMSIYTCTIIFVAAITDHPKTTCKYIAKVLLLINARNDSNSIDERVDCVDTVSLHTHHTRLDRPEFYDTIVVD